MRLMHINQINTLYKRYRIKNSSGVTWGHRGQKVIFKKKPLFLQQITWYDHVTHAYSSARYPLQKWLIWKFTPGHLGSQGSKGHFHQKCYFSFRVHGMVMRLMHINQLNTLYKRYWIKNSSGVTWVKRSFSHKKMLFLQQITWNGHVTHALGKKKKKKNKFVSGRWSENLNAKCVFFFFFFFFFFWRGAKVNFQVNIHIIIQMVDEFVPSYVPFPMQLLFPGKNSSWFLGMYMPMFMLKTQ